MSLLERLQARARKLTGEPDDAAETPVAQAVRLIEEGNALEDVGQSLDALERYDAAVAVAPEFARAHLNRGNALLALGDAEAARGAYETALADAPQYSPAHYNLGNALLHLNRPDEARAAYLKALELNPEFTDAEVALGALYVDMGLRDEAVACYRRALRINPAYPAVHMNLGNVLHELGRHDDAMASYGQFLAMQPGDPNVRCLLGNVQMETGRLHDAVDSYNRVLALDPGHMVAHNNLGNALRRLGRVDEAIASYRTALGIDPGLVAARSNLLFLGNSLANESSKAILAEAKDFGNVVALQAKPFDTWPNSRDAERALRVGFVSGDLRSHPVGYFVDKVFSTLAMRSAGRLELFAYSNHIAFDEVSARIKASCREWCAAAGLSDERLAQQVRDDRIDVLIDLSGHTGFNRLQMFAWKPAPVQVTWLGYLGTTGVQAIDYLIADTSTMPESEEEYFTESIWRLPDSYICFTPPDAHVDVSPLPAMQAGYVTFGSFNNLAKVNDRVVALWSRVLRAVPNSRLFFKSAQFLDTTVRETINDRFARVGVEPGRLMLETLVPRGEYLKPFQRVDIALDPFPYPGITTTVENLWMGVPVLTMSGTTFQSRQGLGLLTNAGLGEWIARDADDYVAKAAAHAADLPRLAELRAALRKRVSASPIFDAPRFADNFEEALRGMWGQWRSQAGSERQT